MNRADKFILPALIAFLLITGIAALARPEVIAGTASPDPDYFIPTNAAPVQTMKPLTLPEWAPETLDGSPVSYFTGRAVFYADGSYLWISKDGTIYEWDMERYGI